MLSTTDRCEQFIKLAGENDFSLEKLKEVVLNANHRQSILREEKKDDRDNMAVGILYIVKGYLSLDLHIVTEKSPLMLRKGQIPVDILYQRLIS